MPRQITRCNCQASFRTAGAAHACAVIGSESVSGTLLTPDTSPSANTRECDTTRSVSSVSAAPCISIHRREAALKTSEPLKPMVPEVVHAPRSRQSTGNVFLLEPGQRATQQLCVLWRGDGAKTRRADTLHSTVPTKIAASAAHPAIAREGQRDARTLGGAVRVVAPGRRLRPRRPQHQIRLQQLHRNRI